MKFVLFACVVLGISVRGSTLEVKHNTTQLHSRLASTGATLAESLRKVANHGHTVIATEPQPSLPPYPTVRHFKDAGGKYQKDSPLYHKQQHRHHYVSEEARHAEGTAVACMLIGAICFVMALFYLVNHPRQKIQKTTWKVLNTTVSIFSSVMIYIELKELCKLLLASVWKYHECVCMLSLFVVLYTVVSGIMYVIKGWPEFVAAGIICAHVNGFAAMYGFACLQHNPPFDVSWLLSFVVVIIAVAVVLPLTSMVEQMRGVVIEHDHFMDKDEQRWSEEVHEIENDVLSLSSGFLLMQVARHWIAGTAQGYEAMHSPEGISQSESNQLLVVSVISAVATVTFTFGFNRIKHAADSVLFSRSVAVGKNMLAKCTAWCLLFWGEWQVYSAGFEGSRMFGVVLNALLMTLIALFGILVLDRVESHLEVGGGKRSLRSLEIALGMLVGFSWEKAFDVAVESIGEALERDHKAVVPTKILKVSLVLGSQLITIPAWYYYVYPKTKHKLDIKEAPALPSAGNAAPALPSARNDKETRSVSTSRGPPTDRAQCFAGLRKSTPSEDGRLASGRSVGGLPADGGGFPSNRSAPEPAVPPSRKGSCVVG